MARGRIITREFGTSESLFSFGNDHALLFACLLPWLDRDGRFSGHPSIIRGQCAPLAGWSDEQVEAMLIDFGRLPDVQYYEAGGGRVIQFDNFSQHQQGYRRGQSAYEREKPSRYAGPWDGKPVTQPTFGHHQPSLKVVGDEGEPF